MTRGELLNLLRAPLDATREMGRAHSRRAITYQLLGNLVPHIHWHIVPRYWGDPAPGRPLSPDSVRCLLKPEEYQQIIAELRAAAR